MIVMGVGIVSCGCLVLMLVIFVPTPVSCHRSRSYRPVFVPHIFQLFGDKGWGNGRTKSLTAAKTTKTTSVSNTETTSSSDAMSRYSKVKQGIVSSSAVKPEIVSDSRMRHRPWYNKPFDRASSYRTFYKSVTGTGE